MKKLTPPADEALVERWVQWLREGNFDQIERGLDPGLRTDDLRDKLQGMAVLIPAQPAKSVKPVGHLVAHHPDSSRTVTTTLEYEFPDQWLLARIVVQQQSGKSSVTGFSVYALPESVERQNGLTLAGKNSAHYGVLFLALAALAVSVYGVIVCIRVPVGKKRWWWAILCLIGVGRLGINWTTGAVGFMPMWIGFPPSGAVAELYSPWIVYTSLPVGAALIIMFRDRLVRSEPSGR